MKIYYSYQKHKELEKRILHYANPTNANPANQALNAIKLSNRDIGSYINKTPQNTGKLEHLEAVRLQVKLDILLGELIEKITYKEWGASKIARSVPLEEGTYFKTDVQTNTKEEVSFESLELSTEELELIRKTGVVWIFTKNQQLT